MNPIRRLVDLLKKAWAGPPLRKIVLVLVVLILVLAIVPKRGERLPDKHSEVPAVSTIVVQPSRIEDRIFLPAVVKARLEATLALDKAGIVHRISAERGDRVTAGQPLLELEQSTWRANLKRAEIEFREADREYRRWEELKSAGAVSASDYDNVKARYDLAKVGLQQAKTDVAKCRLSSPSAGIIVERFLEVGEHAGEGAPAFRLVDIAEVKLTLDIPERDALALKTGMDMAFAVDALPGREFTGTVSFVSAAARSENNAFPAEIRLTNPGEELRPGMIARVALTRAVRQDALVLPLAAVVPLKGEYVVFIVDKGIALRKVVKVDSITDREAVLASGISAGDEVVVAGNRALVDGMPVKPVRQEKAD